MFGYISMRFTDLNEDRYLQQGIRYPDIPKDTIYEISLIDPTPNHLYLRWLNYLYVHGRLDLFKAEQIRVALMRFHKAKLKKQIPEQDRDILRYSSVDDLLRVIAQYRQTQPDWTYTINRANGGTFLIKCRSKIGDVRATVHLREGWLGWTINFRDVDKIRALVGERTGLLVPIVKALYEIIVNYLTQTKPRFITVQGSDKRELLYKSWINWEIPGYFAQVIDYGIAFIRDDQAGEDIMPPMGRDFLAVNDRTS